MPEDNDNQPNAGVELAADDREKELRHGNHRLTRSSQAIRAADINGRPGVSLRAVTYNTCDTYGSVWLSGCLTKGLNQRLPQLCWGHSWEDIIGRASSWHDEAEGPVVDFYFDDFEAVPRAKQANAQVKSGTIDDCSIGFAYNYVFRSPTEDELKRWPDCREVIIEAELDEISLVLRGAVTGAKVLTSRSNKRAMVVDNEAAGKIVVQFAEGNYTLLEALNALQSASIEASAVTQPKSDETTAAPEPETTEEPKVEPTEPVDAPVTPEAPVQSPVETAEQAPQTAPEVEETKQLEPVVPQATSATPESTVQPESVELTATKQEVAPEVTHDEQTEEAQAEPAPVDLELEAMLDAAFAKVAG